MSDWGATEQVPNKYRTSAGQVQDRYRTSTRQVPDKYRISSLVKTIKRADKSKFVSPFFLTYHAMHEVTPSAVAMADSTLMAV